MCVCVLNVPLPASLLAQADSQNFLLACHTERGKQLQEKIDKKEVEHREGMLFDALWEVRRGAARVHRTKNKTAAPRSHAAAMARRVSRDARLSATQCGAGAGCSAAVKADHAACGALVARAQEERRPAGSGR